MTDFKLLAIETRTKVKFLFTLFQSTYWNIYVMRRKEVITKDKMS